MSLPDALAAPRAQQPNVASVNAEPQFISLYGQQLGARGHTFAAPVAEIGAATAIEFLPHGRLLAVAEPVRRGGGDAQVIRR